jgi:hypothetical protein
MGSELPPTDPTLEEQLVAYLDGELDAENCRRIEDLLAADPQARLALQRLERAWEMLDSLGTEPAGVSFTRTTLEMVTVAAEEEVQEQAARRPWRRRRGILTVGGILIAGALGFAVLALLAPDPNRRLVDNLPLLLNLDEYRQGESVEFLRLLQENRLFTDARSPAAPPEITDRRKYVEQLKPDDRADLAQRQERFTALDSEEQRKLSDFETQLNGAPEAAAYRRIMRNYYAWWKTLPDFDRAKLSEMPPAERVRAIQQQLKSDLTAFDPKNLSRQDLEAVQQWFKDFAQKRFERLPQEEKDRIKKNPMLAQHPFAGIWAESRRGQPGPNWPPRRPKIFGKSEVDELRAKLSVDLQKKFDQLSATAQIETLHRWLRYVTWPRLPKRPGPLTDDELAEFFDDPKALSPEEREHLLNLPSDEFQSQLLGQYYLHLRPNRPPGRPDGRPNEADAGPPPGPPPPKDSPSF